MYSFASWAIVVFCLATAVPHCSARHIPHGRFHVKQTFSESTPVADLASVQRHTFSEPANSLHEDLLRKSTIHHTPGLLLPSVSDQVNRHDWQHLVPQKNLQVYYEEGGSGTSAAYVSFRDLKHSTVVLEHSDFVSQVQCTGQKLSVSFSDQGAAKFAFDAWTTANSSKIIIVTNSESCSFGFPAERGWLLVSSIKSLGASAIVCDFSEVPAKEVSRTVEVNFGRASPSPSKKNPPGGHAPKSGPASSRLTRPSTSSTSRASTRHQSSSVSTPLYPGWPQTFSLRKHSSSSSSPRVVIPGSTRSVVASISRLASSYAAVESNSRNSSSSSLYSTTQVAAITSQSTADGGTTVPSNSLKTSLLPTSSNPLSAIPTTLSPVTVFSNTELSASSSVSTSASTSSPDNTLAPTLSVSSSGTTILDAEISTTSSVLVSTSLSVSSNSSSSSSALPTSTTPSNTIQDFDTLLDDSIGYLDPSSSGFWSQLLPGVPSSQTSSFGTATKRLHRRDFDLVSVASSLTQAISSAVSSATSTVDSVVQSASDSFASAVSSVVSAAVALLNSLSPFTLGPFPFSATPANTDTSDFGPGIILTQSSGSSGGVTGQLTTYCVGCGATGSFTLTGTVIFDAEEGISSAIFDIAGNIHAQLELAAVASVSFSESTEKNIFTQGLPALTVTGLIVIGPAVSLDVGATADFSITGGLAAGYQLDWPAITAHFDLTNDIYSAAGLIPTGSPIFDYEGDVKASATVYGLISLTFGLDILSGKYKANVGLVDKPEIDTSAEAVIYSDYQISQMDDGTVYCDGDSLTLSFLDSAYADVVFLNATKTYPLTSWLGPSLSTCIGTLSTVSHSSAATTTDPTDPDPTDPANDEGSSNVDDSASTTVSSTPTASPAATAATQEPASTSTDNPGTSSLPELTTSAPVSASTQGTESSSGNSESTNDPSATQTSATSTPSDDNTTTATDESTTTTATDESTTTTATDERTTTTATDESSTTTTATDESSTTTTTTDESSTTTATDESSTTTPATDESSTISTATDESSTTATATDESSTTTATDDSSTTTATDESSTTTATDESTTTTATDESTTTTATDESSTTTTATDESSTTTTTTDESSTTTATDESSTATTATDESSTTTTATDESLTTTTATDESSTTTTATDKSSTTSTATDESSTTTTATDESSTTTTATDESSTTTTTDESSTTTTATDESSTTTTATDESTTTTTATDESSTTTATDESSTTSTATDGSTTTTSHESTATGTANDESFTTTAADESPTTTATDESLTTTAADESPTTTATDESLTTTAADESPTTTATDESLTTTAADESPTTTATDESLTTTAADESPTTTATDESATATTDESTASTTASEENATTISDDSTATTAQSTTPPSSTATTTVVTVCDPAPLADGYCCDIPPSPIVDTSIAYGIWQYCITTSAADAAWAEWVDCGGEDVNPSSPDLSDFISCALDVLDAIEVDDTSSCDIYEPDDMDAYYMCEMEITYSSFKYNDLAILVDSDVEKRRKRDSATSLSDATIQDAINGTTFISWAADGNLIVSNASNSFSSLNGNIIGDTESRLLHIYNDTIADQGVSRLRLASLDLMPLTSILVTLAPISVPSESSPILVAFTSAGSFYYLITCIMDEQAPKIFLAADVGAGVSALQSPSLQDTITGGTVTECGLMSWTTG